MEIRNKTAIVTGGTHGIGAHTAIERTKHGACIAIVARNKEEQSAKKKIEQLGVPCQLIAADVYNSFIVCY